MHSTYKLIVADYFVCVCGCMCAWEREAKTDLQTEENKLPEAPCLGSKCITHTGYSIRNLCVDCESMKLYFYSMPLSCWHLFCIALRSLPLNACVLPPSLCFPITTKIQTEHHLTTYVTLSHRTPHHPSDTLKLSGHLDSGIETAERWPV